MNPDILPSLVTSILQYFKACLSIGVGGCKKLHKFQQCSHTQGEGRKFSEEVMYTLV